MPDPNEAFKGRLAAVQQQGETVYGKEKFDLLAEALAQSKPDPEEMTKMLLREDAAAQVVLRGRDALNKLADDDPLYNRRLVALRSDERADFRKLKGR